LRKGSCPKFEEQKGDDFALTFDGISSKQYTGLQVTKDPGVWIVWLGSGLMIFGLIVSFFFSHQRVWVKIPKGDLKTSHGEIVFAGSANRNRIGFEKTFHQMTDRVRPASENRKTM
jgi:cytochrome c biogenesis protein